MAGLGRSMLVNVGGRAWTAVVQIAFMPVLLRLLGADGFGLIGVFLTLQAAALVLENAYAMTVNREIARRRDSDPASVPGVLRTAEILAWGTATGFAVLLALLTPLLADAWVSAETLADATLARALWLMAPALGLQLGAGLYVGALLAGGRHGTANALLVTTATLRSGGAAAVLLTAGGGVLTYFAWQIAVALLHAALGRLLAWRHVGRHVGRGSEAGGERRFVRAHLRLFASFGGGMLGIGLLGALLTQMDRIVLARWAGLSELGYYTFAAGLAGVLLYLAGPITQGVFPSLSAALGRGDRAEAGSVFALGTQVLGAVAIPAGLVLAVFGREVVTVWTGDAALAARLAPLLALLAVGSTLNALVYLPSHLYLASGRTGLVAGFSAGAAVILGLALVPLVDRHGALGAAAGWVGLNLAYVLVLAPLLLRRVLPGAAPAWAGRAVLVPAVVAAVPVGLARLALPADAPLAATVGLPVAAGLAAVTAAALAAPEVRRRLVRRRRAPS
ncbi:lipopolysaccharide biosynthesis protein [Novispirillum sp. DQ9]|uniref:lipopolysaccharide biosynthesis protein n=1 Tax=Novispirillum sp. DQ9 TaxID=3398612 RepID=UPI003C7A4ED3